MIEIKRTYSTEKRESDRGLLGFFGVCVCCVVAWYSECEIVESQTFSLSRMREAFFKESQEDMNTDSRNETRR